MDVPSACQPRNAARSARHERSIVAVPSERRLSPRSDRSLGVSRADRRTGLAACKPMHRHWRSARRGKCSAIRVAGRPRYSARRAKVGFGGKCGNSRAPRADGTHAWVCDHRFEQLARIERDLMAHTTALETADAAKWVNRQECLTQPRATISMGISTGPSGRSVTESAARCLGPSPIGNAKLPKVDNSTRIILDF